MLGQMLVIISLYVINNLEISLGLQQGFDFRIRQGSASLTKAPVVR